MPVFLRQTLPMVMKNIKLHADKAFERNDILGKIMAAREEKTGQPLTPQQVVVESVTLLTGGTHTTGNSLHLLFANLARNPQHLRRAIEEIDSELPPLGQDQAAYSINGLEEKLDFVNAAIRETHRKDPVGTFNMPRTVPEEGIKIAGYSVPIGVRHFT